MCLRSVWVVTGTQIFPLAGVAVVSLADKKRLDLLLCGEIFHGGSHFIGDGGEVAFRRDLWGHGSYYTELPTFMVPLGMSDKSDIYRADFLKRSAFSSPRGTSELTGYRQHQIWPVELRSWGLCIT